MRIPTIGGLRQTVNLAKIRKIDTQVVENGLRIHGDEFQWTDETKLDQARAQLKEKASDHRSNGLVVGMGGAFATLVGGGLAAVSAGIAGAAALPIIGGAVAVGGVGALIYSASQFGKGGKYAMVAKDMKLFQDAERAQAPPVTEKNPSLSREDKVQKQMARAVQTIKFSAQRSIDRLDRSENSEPGKFQLKNQKKTEGLVSSALCDTYFTSSGKIEGHQLVEFEASYVGRGPTRKHSFKPVEGGTLYTTGGTHQTQILEDSSGRLVLMESLK